MVFTTEAPPGRSTSAAYFGTRATGDSRLLPASAISLLIANGRSHCVLVVIQDFRAVVPRTASAISNMNCPASTIGCVSLPPPGQVRRLSLGSLGLRRSARRYQFIRPDLYLMLVKLNQIFPESTWWRSASRPNGRIRHRLPCTRKTTESAHRHARPRWASALPTMARRSVARRTRIMCDGPAHDFITDMKGTGGLNCTKRALFRLAGHLIRYAV